MLRRDIYLAPWSNFLSFSPSLTHPPPVGSLQGEYQRRLYKELMENYNRLERPVLNDSNPVLVELGMTLLQIIDVVSLCVYFRPRPFPSVCVCVYVCVYFKCELGIFVVVLVCVRKLVWVHHTHTHTHTHIYIYTYIYIYIHTHTHTKHIHTHTNKRSPCRLTADKLSQIIVGSQSKEKLSFLSVLPAYFGHIRWRGPSEPATLRQLCHRKIPKLLKVQHYSTQRPKYGFYSHTTSVIHTYINK